MFRFSWVIVASCTLLFAPIFLAEPLSAQGQSPFQADVSLVANGGAFEFDGVGPGIDLGKSSILDFSGGDFTVHAWVVFASLCPNTDWCDEPIVSNISTSTGGPNQHGWHLMKQNDRHFWFCLGGGNGVNGCTPDADTTVISRTVPVIGVWYNVTGVKVSNQIMIYVNGVLEGTSTPASFSDASNAPVLVGASQEGFYLDGQVAQVQLFRSALSGPHVRAMFEQSKKGYGY